MFQLLKSTFNGKIWHNLKGSDQVQGFNKKIISKKHEDILNALTIIPATFIGKQKLIGTINVGKLANFIVFDKPIFDLHSHLIENWIQGKQYTVNKKAKSINGYYKLTFNLDHLIGAGQNVNSPGRAS